MDFALASSLVLAFLFIGNSYTEGTSHTSECYDLCPAGYHKDGDCDGPVQKHHCKPCEDGTFTAISNFIQKCLRCDSCGRNENEVHACSPVSNVVCDCKKGFYNAGSGSDDRHCRSCPTGKFNKKTIPSCQN